MKRWGNTACHRASWPGFKSLPKCLCASFSSARLLLRNAKLPAHRHTDTHTHALVGKQRFNYPFPKLSLTFDPLKYFLKRSCRVADRSPFWSLTHTRKQTLQKVGPGSSCQQQSASVCPESTLYSWSDDRNKWFYKCWLRTFVILYTFPCMHADASKTSEPRPLITNSHSGQCEYIIQDNVSFTYINFQKSCIKVQKCMCITNRERWGVN